mmetsp:Transcript_2695/g.4009  ORF Transcript_2695/g.4009 Transcript_2695/m.4009 type:complete len:95 (+) Transcript_2695:555-839(+)
MSIRDVTVFYVAWISPPATMPMNMHIYQSIPSEPISHKHTTGKYLPRKTPTETINHANVSWLAPWSQHFSYMKKTVNFSEMGLHKCNDQNKRIQ